MKMPELQIDLNKLPFQAQLELLDFYEFLLHKYTVSKPATIGDRFSEFLATPIQVDKLPNWNRDELHER
jgi:hypothetical protein